MSALYEKNRLITRVSDETTNIMFNVQHGLYAVEQGEQLLDDLLVRFNRELLEITKTDCEN